MNLETDLKERIVAFIDVLGFSEKVLKKSNKEIEDYFNTIEKCFSAIRKTQSFKSISISDSIIIVVENSEDDFKTLIQIIKFLQINLSLKNIWLRGGVALGEVYFDDTKSILVGNGFIEAVNLEKQAIYPRVIISPKMIPKFSKNMRDFIYKFNGEKQNSWEYKKIHDYNIFNGKRITTNDAIFICYANQFIGMQIIKSDTITFDKSQLKKVIDFIEGGMYSEQKHYHKYKWLLDYFHETFIEYQPKISKKNLEMEKFYNDASKYFGLHG